MKKEELKKAFEKEFNNITLSDELKKKTLEKINNTKQQKTFIPYIRNIAAVFVVTMICLSLYLAKNPITNTNSINSVQNTDNIILEESTNQNYSTQKIAPVQNSIKQPSKQKSNDFSIQENALKETRSNLPPVKSYLPPVCSYPQANSQSLDLYDTAKIENEKILTEKDFLEKYPDAEKIENGYKIIENNKETIYVFKDGVLENTIIIE